MPIYSPAIDPDTLPVVCELCPRQSEVSHNELIDDADGQQYGWAYTWDGWICPGCCSKLEQE